MNSANSVPIVSRQVESPTPLKLRFFVAHTVDAARQYARLLVGAESREKCIALDD